MMIKYNSALTLLLSLLWSTEKMQKASDHHLLIYFFPLSLIQDDKASRPLVQLLNKLHCIESLATLAREILLFSNWWSSARKNYPYSLLILATDIAAFNLHPDWQDIKPQLKPVPLLSNQLQMTRTQGSPLTYCNKLLTLSWVNEQPSTQNIQLRGSIKCRRKELILQTYAFVSPLSSWRRWLAKGTRHGLLCLSVFCSQKDLSLRVLR